MITAAFSPRLPGRPAVVLAALFACGALGCQDITTGPGNGVGDVDLYDVDVELDTDRNDGTSDTDGGGGGGGGGGAGPALPPPEPDQVPSCEKTWITHILPREGREPASPDSEAYVPPPKERRDALRTAIQRARRDRWEEAREALASSGYDVCRSSDRNGDVLVWHPTGEPKGWARLVLRLDRAARPLFLQVPHPFSEPAPAEQATNVFTGVAARAILVAGAHRCANTAHSACDGRTDACGTPNEDYRTSDMAHAPETFFQLFHRQTASFFSETLVLSLHTYADRTGASLSNGTTEAVDSRAPVARLGDVLENEFEAHDFTYCNRIPDRSHETRDCGSTNLQGRHLNGAREVCRNAPGSATGRFLRLHHGLLDPENPSGLAGPLRDFLSSR